MVFIPPLKPLGSIVEVEEGDGRYVARINEEVELKDGARIRLNVFLPRGDGPWPVLMTSSPYGKDVPYDENEEYKEGGMVIPQEHKCKHVRFEAASPAYWCPRGYALVYWDHRGASQSPGYLKVWSSEHFDDYAQMIEWAADQPWSTGKIGLQGISYLGSNQWPTAARRPRGLAAICPWEGFGDFYREAARHGGITASWWRRWVPVQVRPIQYGSRDRVKNTFGPESPEGELTEEQLAENREDLEAAVRDPENEFIDDEFYRDRMTLENYGDIEVPVLSAANWGGINLHLRGNVISYLRAGSKYKFLRVHTGRHDLPFFFSPYVEQMVSFFDCFLRDDDYGGWKTGKQPAVRFNVRRGAAPIGLYTEAAYYEWRDENEWPLARTKYEKLHLHADQSLDSKLPNDEGVISYKARTGDGFLFKTAPATSEYEICGHPSVRLSISLSDHKGDTPADIDVYIALRKYNKDGKEVFYSGTKGDPTAIVFGWARASHRTISPKPYRELGELPFPVLSHKRSDRKGVEEKEVYDLQFELWPTQVVVEEGESLGLEVLPKDPANLAWFGADEPTQDRTDAKLNGTNHLHIGSKYHNYVVLPIV